MLRPTQDNGNGFLADSKYAFRIEVGLAKQVETHSLRLVVERRKARLFEHHQNPKLSGTNDRRKILRLYLLIIICAGKQQ
jgi:hypothetical protein